MAEDRLSSLSRAIPSAAVTDAASTVRFAVSGAIPSASIETNRWYPCAMRSMRDTEIRTVIYTTNAIESINARIRKAVRARGHFPTEQAAMKCVYLAIMSLDPTGKGRQRWTNRWKPALNAFTIAFPNRIITTPR